MESQVRVATSPAHQAKAVPRLLLADSERLLVDALGQCLRRQSGMELVGRTTDADEVLHMARREQADLLMIGVELKESGILDLIQELHALPWTPRTVLLVGRISDSLLDEALAAQVAGVLLKSDPFDALLAGLRRVAGGHPHFSRAIGQRIEFDAKAQRYCVEQHRRLQLLSGRQIEVLIHLANGKSVNEVAETMQLSPKSVESHKYRIMHQLDIHDRVNLARYAIREGLVPL